jgi:hypothetical protein
MNVDHEQLLTRVADKARADRPPYARDGLPAPVDDAAVARAEAELGFPLPPLLAGLYRRVADGGFGPEYGLLSLHGAGRAEEAVVPAHLSLLDDPEWPLAGGGSELLVREPIRVSVTVCECVSLSVHGSG